MKDKQKEVFIKFLDSIKGKVDKTESIFCLIRLEDNEFAWHVTNYSKITKHVEFFVEIMNEDLKCLVMENIQKESVDDSQ